MNITRIKNDTLSVSFQSCEVSATTAFVMKEAYVGVEIIKATVMVHLRAATVTVASSPYFQLFPGDFLIVQ